MRQRLCVQNFGPIRNVDMDFGDLTVLIGPQASGKSLLLELFKLVKDKAHIVSTLKKYNYILNKSDINPLLEYYFGEGMSQVLSDSTEISFDGEKLILQLSCKVGIIQKRRFFMYLLREF